MITATARAAVLDIEGTTGSAAHVYEVLFPYARVRLADWFASHRDDPRHGELLAEVGEVTGTAVDEAGAIAALTAWADADVKAAPLKRLQGLIWAEGFADGTLTGHVYPDVPPALRRWQAAGIDCYIYSSGSVTAQRDWFGHSNEGDLSGLLRGHFDLGNAGAKTEAASYRSITRAIGTPPHLTVFLSDRVGELDAAAAAGWQTVAVRRPEDPSAPMGEHPLVAALDQIQLNAHAPAGPTGPGSPTPRDEDPRS
ncbi:MULTISPECIES: acireductone synthase [Streptomyces]|uniref:acireductone synthase n=1 Tax=Streptomyces TaxID=1883 RepID=UPI0004BEDE56|nr:MULTISPECIES: acireductone synthase [Streptomyces]